MPDKKHKHDHPPQDQGPQPEGNPVLDKDGKPVLDKEGNPLLLAGKIEIDVYSNLEVTVRNFPTDQRLVMIIMANAIKTVSEFFLNEGKEFAVKPPLSRSNLVLTKPGMSMEDILKIAKKN